MCLCVPNVADVCELPILDCPFGFLKHFCSRNQLILCPLYNNLDLGKTEIMFLEKIQSINKTGK